MIQSQLQTNLGIKRALLYFKHLEAMLFTRPSTPSAHLPHLITVWHPPAVTQMSFSITTNLLAERLLQNTF